MALAEDGRHVWPGRATDPTEAELARLAEGLSALGLGGWLAIIEGEYWQADSPMTLLLVRQLATPRRDGWEAAVAAFRARREDALRKPS